MHEDAPKLRIAFDLLLFDLELEVFALLVEVLLATAEIHHEDLILLLAQAHQEVVGLDIVIDDSLGMHPLDSF